MIGLRKYTLALLASLSGGLLCYTGHITGAEWAATQSGILALYKAADVLNRRNNAPA